MEKSIKNDLPLLTFHPIPVGVHFFKSPAQRVSSRRKESLDELIVMLNGHYSARNQGNLLTARAGDVVYWPAQSERVEENDPAKPTECISIYFRWPSPSKRLSNRVHDSGSLIRLLALRLLGLKEEPLIPEPAPIGMAYLAAILAEHARLSIRPEDPLVARVADYVERNLAQPFALKDLSDTLGLNRYYLGRAFKKRTGMSPMEFVRRKRVEHALGMFTNNPNFTMRSVAARIGLHDDVQLRRLLRRYTGISARSIAKLSQSKQSKAFLAPATFRKPPR